MKSPKNKASFAGGVRFALCFSFLMGSLGASGFAQSEQVDVLEGVPVVEYELVGKKAFDITAFTQGLQWVDNVLYLGTGLYGKSQLRAIDWETGDLLKKHALPKGVFGEGVTVVGGMIYQLTWKTGMLYIYEQDDFSLEDILFYDGEGWGITHNDQELIMSNGSSKIYFRDMKTFEVLREIEATAQGRPVDRLNELEYINGFIFANRWGTPDILMIDPKSGEVTGRMRLDGIVDEIKKRIPKADVLNGIAYIAESELLVVTGKLWDTLYLLKIKTDTE